MSQEHTLCIYKHVCPYIKVEIKIYAGTRTINISSFFLVYISIMWNCHKTITEQSKLQLNLSIMCHKVPFPKHLFCLEQQWWFDICRIFTTIHATYSRCLIGSNEFPCVIVRDYSTQRYVKEYYVPFVRLCKQVQQYAYCKNHMQKDIC